jgi:hypothetical protein
MNKRFSTENDDSPSPKKSKTDETLLDFIAVEVRKQIEDKYKSIIDALDIIQSRMHIINNSIFQLSTMDVHTSFTNLFKLKMDCITLIEDNKMSNKVKTIYRAYNYVTSVPEGILASYLAINARCVLFMLNCNFILTTYILPLLDRLKSYMEEEKTTNIDTVVTKLNTQIALVINQSDILIKSINTTEAECTNLLSRVCCG